MNTDELSWELRGWDAGMDTDNWPLVRQLGGPRALCQYHFGDELLKLTGAEYYAAMDQFATGYLDSCYK